MRILIFIAFLSSAGLLRADQPEIVFADFEGETYGGWKTTGTAFGSGPAQGTLPNQMPVNGFVGKGLVNSYRGGDAASGTLVSPDFKVERKHIAFLIGGGGHAGKTCMNLLMDGKMVRTATGTNTEAGGSEKLELAVWDVAELIGKEARIEIVDAATGGWGHINIDQIVFTDKKPELSLANVSREIKISANYLFFPVQTGVAKRKITLKVGGIDQRSFDIELAEGKPDWLAPLDISSWKGQLATLQVDKLPADSKALKSIEQGNELKDGPDLYRENLRPQLHFSARRGWLNDPNGLVYANGEYHLFFQHNPYGWAWGNMHWGHAVSKDLIHWEELPIALYPRKYGDWAFSGSAIVDKANTSGWKKGEDAPLVLAYTSTGRGECIAYSHDRGRTWSEYEGNPVVKHEGRDPRLLWHEVSQQWVMAVYDESDKKRWIAFYKSADLKKWIFQSRLEGFYECPDLFELPVDDDAKKRKWVLIAADSDYMVGTFDGRTFTPETAKLKGQRGQGFYAAQTFSNEPKGRVVQIGWFQTATPGMPFNQSMTVPLELKLIGTADGPRLTWNPVKELEALRTRSQKLGPLELKPEGEPLKAATGELVELRTEFKPEKMAVVTITVRGITIVYDAAKQEIRIGDHRAPAPLRDGKQNLTILIDRMGLELFTNGGLTYVPLPIAPKADDRALAVSVKGGTAQLESLEVHELKSIWVK